MAGGIDWFRWHHGSVSDPKFQLVAKRSGASVAEVIAVWASLLEAASMSDQRGHPGEPDFEAIDCGLGLEEGKSEVIYSQMAMRGLVAEDGRITAWEKRQPKREDDTAAERKRKQREREHELAVTSRIVPESHDASRTVTQGHDRGEERREEINTVVSPLAPTTPRGSRLDPDWSLPDDWRTWAKTERPDLDPSEVADTFRDYWVSVAGQKGRKADWQATWRNWVRSQKVSLRKPVDDDPYGLKRAVNA